jgi:hypothetical protein
LNEIGLLKKSTEYIVKKESKKREIDQIIDLLLDTKKNLSLHILNSREADTFIKTISDISKTVRMLNSLKANL